MVLSGMGGTQKIDDPYLWLEDIVGEKQLVWVKEQNAKSIAQLGESTEFQQLAKRLRSILDSDEKIPRVRKIGDRYYNFWRDTTNPRGIWRRTTLEEYRKENPKWEIVIDLDSLAQAENENWIWHGATVLEPEDRRCILALSRGGADADVKREFDLVTKEFVEGGFTLVEAKS